MENSLESHEEQPPLGRAVVQTGTVHHITNPGPATLYHLLPEGAILAFPAEGLPSQFVEGEGLQNCVPEQQLEEAGRNLLSLEDLASSTQYVLTLAYEEGVPGKDGEVLAVSLPPEQPQEVAPPSPDRPSPEEAVSETEEVAIDISKPIELAQNSVIVVNGQKCVLQQDPSSGKVVAYPVRPRRRRGRPRKTEGKTKDKAPPTSFEDEEQNPEEPVDEILPEIPGEKGLVEVATEEGTKVKRSCRRKKKSNIFKDYETGHLQELGSEEDQAGSRLEEEAPFPYKKKKLNKIPGRRGPGRPSLASKDQPQTFLIQVESSTGQVLHIKLQARAMPDNPTLQAHLAKLGIKSNKIFPVVQPPSTSTDGAAGGEPAGLEATSLIPVPAKRKPGRPRKYPAPNPPRAVTTTKPTFITLTSSAPEMPQPAESVVTFDPNLELPTPSYDPAYCSPTALPLPASSSCHSPPPSSGLDSMMPDSTPLADFNTENAPSSVSLLVSEQPSLELNSQETDVPSSALDPLINSSVGTCLFLTEDMSLSLATEPLFAEVNNKPVADLPLPADETWKDYKNEAEIQICSLCDFHSNSKPYFQQHLKSAHPDNFLQCDQAGCKFSALSQEEMDDHTKEAHQHCICSECGHEEYRQSSMKKHMEKHAAKLHTCDICSKNYKDQYVLRMHRKLVHEPASTLYECTVCSKSFNRKAHLKRHQRIHNPAKPFKCDYCDYRGCDRSVLKKHLLIHQEPKHTCEICGRTFRHLPNWHLHLKRHKGQRDYKCGACNFFGYTLTDIKKHIERRHKEVVAAAHVCQQCSCAFDSAAQLQDHAATCGSNLVCIQNKDKEGSAVTISLSDLDLLVGKQSNIIMVDQEGQQVVFLSSQVAADVSAPDNAATAPSS